MLVRKRMTKNPQTVAMNDTLATAYEKMQAGNFRRVPVVQDGKLVGLVTDRDLRQHSGHLRDTRVTGAMTEKVITVTPDSTLESAAKLMLERKIGGLPVVEGEKLVGIITTSDVLSAFLDVIGATEEGSARIDLLLEGPPHDLADASAVIAREGGEILGVGTYRERWEEGRVFYLVLRTKDVEHVTDVLRQRGFSVLGVH